MSDQPETPAADPVVPPEEPASIEAETPEESVAEEEQVEEPAPEPEVPTSVEPERPTFRAPEVAALQACLDEIQVALEELRAGIEARRLDWVAELDTQKARAEMLVAQTNRLEQMLDALPLEPEPVEPPPDEEEPPPDEEEPPPVDPPPPPPLPLPGWRDPLSGLPWRSGFGQCAAVLRKLEQMRGRPAGVVAGWTNYSVAAKDWAGLRGGPLGKPAAMEGIFNRAGASNFHDFVNLVDRRCLLVWIVPSLPTNIGNEYIPQAKAKKLGKKAGWTNPGIWKRLIDKSLDRGVAVQNWTDFGERLGYYLDLHKINPDLFILVLGWEGTGNWYPWSVGPDVQSHTAYWRLMVDSLRAGLRKTLPKGWDRVRFEYRLAGVTRFVAWNPLASFPGNEHAAVLGCSLHGGLDSLGDPEGWRQEVMGGVADKVGLEPARQLAVQQGIKLGIDEWGIVSREGDPYHPRDPNPYKGMRNVLQWFEDHARDISHECFLYSSKYNLLDKTWPGQAGYVANLNAVIGRANAAKG